MQSSAGPVRAARPPAPSQREQRDERTGATVAWCGVAAVTGAVALLIVEAAAIPFQVSQSVTAADSMQYFWPLLGVILLGCVGTAAIRGGRRFRRAAQRRREWAPAVRR